MPLYDYECEISGKVVERCVKMAERDTQTCNCGGALKQVILQGPAFSTKFTVGVTKSAAKYLGPDIANPRAVLDLPD